MPGSGFCVSPASSIGAMYTTVLYIAMSEGGCEIWIALRRSGVPGDKVAVMDYRR